MYQGTKAKTQFLSRPHRKGFFFLIMALLISFVSLSGALAASKETGADAPAQPLEIRVDHWPESGNRTISGQVLGLENPGDYRLSLWIHVPGSGNNPYWPKPTYAEMLQRLGKNGSFSINAYSHVNDAGADGYVLMLFPKEYKPDSYDMEENRMHAILWVAR